MSADNGSNSNESVIRLGQFLKFIGAARTGGECKSLIQDGEVMVNGQVEVRRGRHLYLGDLVRVHGEDFLVEQERDDVHCTGQA